ncbi:hypothetical protein OESDEN_10902 [Oesophagostomum dentatum]|uniref:Uncharacterized protein n=1 Tax=Oesophagostomum dentatum TaxID=61180 RepID=A0A0B1T0I8_OESDE|nr:hypothetical protein OESDEN_10902 [Oesophagostomum dentatum]
MWAKHMDRPAPFNLAQLLGTQLEQKKDEESKQETKEEPKEESKQEETLKQSVGVNLELPKMEASSISPSGSSEASASTEQNHEHTDASSIGRSGESDGDDRKPLQSQESSTAIAAPERPVAPSTPTRPVENPLEAMQKMWAETEPPPPRQVRTVYYSTTCSEFRKFMKFPGISVVSDIFISNGVLLFVLKAFEQKLLFLLVEEKRGHYFLLRSQLNLDFDVFLFPTWPQDFLFIQS